MNKVAKSGTLTDGSFFFGEYEHCLDAQRRVAIPKPWRKSDSCFYLLPGRGGAIFMLPLTTFKGFLEKAGKVSFANVKMQRALARFGSMVQECRCDKQGRIQMPQKLLDTAGIVEHAVLVGAFTNVQIWSPEAWKKQGDADESFFDDIQAIGESEDDFLSMIQGVVGD